MNLIKFLKTVSDYIIGFQLKKLLFDKYVEFLEVIADGCQINKKAFKIPLKVGYGYCSSYLLFSIAH